MNFEDQINLVRDKISNSKKPIMFFDNDCDGTTSYIQLKRTFPKIVGYPMKYKNWDQQEEYFNSLELEQDFDLIVIFDVPFIERGFFEHFKGKEIIWADHHNANSKELIEEFNVVHLNPLNYDLGDSRPSAYLAYRVCNKKENLFYATIGTFGDISPLDDVFIELYNYSPKFFSYLFKLEDKEREEIFEFIKKNSFKYKGVEDEKLKLVYYLTYDAGYIKYKNLIDFTFKLDDDEQIRSAINVLASLSPEELNSELIAGQSFPFDRYYQTLEIYNLVKKKAMKKKPENGIYFYNYKGERGFSMTLSDEMNHVQSDSDVVAICFNKKGKEFYQCSFRSKKTNVPNLINKCMEGLDGGGGGHPQAAGARISKEDFDIFKKRIKGTKLEVLEN